MAAKGGVSERYTINESEALTMVQMAVAGGAVGLGVAGSIGAALAKSAMNLMKREGKKGAAEFKKAMKIVYDDFAKRAAKTDPQTGAKVR